MTRQDLVQNAVEFLSSREAASSSLTNKIEFLQQKGLDDSEIQEALTKSQSSFSPTVTGPGTGPVPAPDFYRGPPPLPSRDWKDVLVMTTATVGLGYGLYAIMKNYLIPYVLPPEKAELEKDKEEISREFSRVENFLKEYDARQTEFLQKQEERSSRIDQTLNDISEIIAKTNAKNEQNEQSLKLLKTELEGLKNTMVSNLNGVRTSVVDELSRIEVEVGKLTGVEKKANKEESPRDNHEKKSSDDVASKLRQVPPTTSVPSAEDILKGKSDDGIPAWQKARKTDSIPEWQLRS